MSNCDFGFEYLSGSLIDRYICVYGSKVSKIQVDVKDGYALERRKSKTAEE